MVTLTESLLRQLHERLAPLHVSALHPLAGGASSLTYAGILDGRGVVVKVATPGVRPIAHRDVLRQARILRALAPTPVPVPKVLHDDPGDPPEVPPLFVMSWLEGIAHEPLFDNVDAGSPAVVAERYRLAAATMAQLHRVDPGSVGLASEPVVGPSAEVERWCRTLVTVDAALAPGWPDAAAALRSRVPASLPPALVHGDFRLGNLLAAGNRLTAVIDWEIWSVGDPRVDAGWFLVNSDPQTYRRSTRYSDGTPSVGELAAIYRSELRNEVPELAWFQALACFKSTATWSLIVKHNRRRRAPDPDLEAMALVLPQLLARTRELLR